MNRRVGWVFLGVVLLFTLLVGDAFAQKTPRQRSRKHSRKEEVATKAPTPAEAPVWKEGDSPLSSYLWAVRQLPDLSRFPPGVSSISFQAVVLKDDEVVFFDGCRFDKKKGFWKLVNCTSSTVGQTQPMGKLVTQFGDMSPDFRAALNIGELLAKVRGRKKVSDLEPLLNPAGSKGKGKGHVQLDLLDADARLCGHKTCRKRFKELPQVTYVGEHVLLWSVTYSMGESGVDGTVTLGLVRTKEGWRISELRVQCAP